MLKYRDAFAFIGRIAGENEVNEKKSAEIQDIITLTQIFYLPAENEVPPQVQKIEK